jgi:hypothetical protein
MAVEDLFAAVEVEGSSGFAVQRTQSSDFFPAASRAGFQPRWMRYSSREMGVLVDWFLAGLALESEYGGRPANPRQSGWMAHRDSIRLWIRRQPDPGNPARMVPWVHAISDPLQGFLSGRQIIQTTRHASGR